MSTHAQRTSYIIREKHPMQKEQRPLPKKKPLLEVWLEALVELAACDVAVERARGTLVTVGMITRKRRMLFARMVGLGDSGRKGRDFVRDFSRQHRRVKVVFQAATQNAGFDGCQAEGFAENVAGQSGIEFLARKDID